MRWDTVRNGNTRVARARTAWNSLIVSEQQSDAIPADDRTFLVSRVSLFFVDDLFTSLQPNFDAIQIVLYQFSHKLNRLTLFFADSLISSYKWCVYFTKQYYNSITIFFCRKELLHKARVTDELLACPNPREIQQTRLFIIKIFFGRSNSERNSILLHDLLSAKSKLICTGTNERNNRLQLELT